MASDRNDGFDRFVESAVLFDLNVTVRQVSADLALPIKFSGLDGRSNTKVENLQPPLTRSHLESDVSAFQL